MDDRGSFHAGLLRSRIYENRLSGQRARAMSKNPYLKSTSFSRKIKVPVPGCPLFLYNKNREICLTNGFISVIVYLWLNLALV